MQVFKIIKILCIGPYIAAAILVIFGLLYAGIGFAMLGGVVMLIQTLLIGIGIGIALIFENGEDPAMKREVNGK